MARESASELFQKAAELRAKRRYNLALECYKNISDLFGPSAELFVEGAVTAYAASDFAQVVSQTRAALELDPLSVTALLYLALATEFTGDTAGSLSAYKRLITADPGCTIAYNNRGLLYSKLGRLGDAVTDFNEAIRVDPSDYKAHYNRANLLYELKRYDDSFAAYASAVSTNPIYLMAYSNRAATYLELERYPEAIQGFTEAIHCEPRAVPPLVSRGMAHWKNGNPSEGYSDLRRAMDLDPFNPWPASTLGTLLEKDGRWPDALQYFDKAADLLDGDAKAKAEELRTQLGSEDPRRESDAIAEMFPIHSTNKWVDIISFWLKRIERTTEQTASALWQGVPFPDLLTEIRELTQGRDAHYLRGLGDNAFASARTAYREDGRKRDAIRQLYLAVAYYSLGGDIEHLTITLTNLGLALGDIRHVDAALRVENYVLEFKRMIGSPQPNIARSLRIIAEIEAVRGNYVQARNLYESAANIYVQAGLERAGGELADKIAHLDSVLYLLSEIARSELQPPVARTCAQWTADAMGEIERSPRDAALKLYFAVESARRAGKTAEQLRARLALAQCLYRRFSMFHEAYRHFGAAVVLASSIGDENAEVEALLEQARASIEAGDFSMGRELLRLALSKVSAGNPSRLRAEVQILLSMACFELESNDESRTYLDMAMSDAQALPFDGNTLDWFVRQGLIFQAAYMPRQAVYVWWARCSLLRRFMGFGEA
jgi:tetratricopeptide (TPR) repeat protein